MAQGQFNRRTRAGRNADDDNLVDLQFGEKCRMRVGLGGGRRIRRDRRSKIAEAGRGDDAKSVTDKFSGVGEPLVIATAGAMDGEKWLAGAFFCKFDRTCGRVCHAATAARGSPRTTGNVAVGEEYKDTPNDESNRRDCRK